ncbi:Aste57867_8480 [Aphanomyces stellatus]|uniref:Aste57867_8480 protein n=1 Tax=Aphanomyces stellatus TaxID=120398 RepID=A0A485KKE7_9STRA|nr:hypothetical protein As57867_008448 [Aphanomyces stellatus]VFT85366.1 Aste57867_8480 [Aphanomyces stellatus]
MKQATPRRSVGLKHPLPPNFFVCPQTTPDEDAAWIATGLSALKALVRDTQLEGGSIPWTLDYDSNGLQIYWGSDMGHNANSNSSSLVFMSVTELQGTLDEAAALHMADTHDEYHTYNEKYNKDVIDCAVLKTLAPATEDHPHNYIGLKWLTLETPSAIRNRDFSFVECRDEFSLHDVAGWARVMHSVDLPWVPSLRDSMGIVRAVYDNSGVVFKELPNRPGYLQVLQLYNANLRGAVPLWVARLGIKRRARSLLRYDSYFRSMRLGSEPLLSDQDLVPTSSRRKCFLCQHTFGPFSKRMNCRRCGEVVCRHCNNRWDITDTRGVTRAVRVCFKCSTGPPAAGMYADSDNEGGSSSHSFGSDAVVGTHPIHAPRYANHPNAAAAALLHSQDSFDTSLWSLHRPTYPTAGRRYDEDDIQLASCRQGQQPLQKPDQTPAAPNRSHDSHRSSVETYTPDTQESFWGNTMDRQLRREAMNGQCAPTTTSSMLSASGRRRPATRSEPASQQPTTVSRAHLVDMYRQLKQMKVGPSTAAI